MSLSALTHVHQNGRGVQMEGPHPGFATYGGKEADAPGC